MNINKKIIIITILVVLVVIVLYLTRYQKPLFGNLDGYFAGKAALSQSSPRLQKQSSEEGDVAVEAAPIMVSSAGVDMTVRLTTHSVDLDFDLLEKAQLRDDNNHALSPISWDGGRGGHHLFGTLKFPSFNEKTSAMKLIIKNVAGVQERIFEWKL